MVIPMFWVKPLMNFLLFKVTMLIAETHLQNVSVYISKCRPCSKYENVKMKIFVLTLSGDALDWFIKFRDNTFDSINH